MNEDKQKAAATDLQRIIAEQNDKIKEQQKYMEALVSEFAQCDDLEATRQTFRDKITEFAPNALVNIINLANNAESESVRASMNKWVVDWAMSDKIDAERSDLKKFLDSVSSQPNQPAATEATN